MQTPYITDIQRFSTKDGDGIRTTVFFKGCTLSCKWCHNPETIDPLPQLQYFKTKCFGCGKCSQACPNTCHTQENGLHIFDRNNCTNCFLCTSSCPSRALAVSAKQYSAPALCELLSKDKVFYSGSGGVTFSGGEPLLYPDFLLECIRRLTSLNIDCNIDTSGCVPQKNIAALKGTNVRLLYDLKDTNSARLKENTGAGLDTVLNNLFYADGLGLKSRLRLIIIKGINDNIGHIEKVRLIKSKLQFCEGIDLIAYHPYMASKYESLGTACRMCGAEFVPDKETIQNLKKYIGV